jgi:hypothetical protein
VRDKTALEQHICTDAMNTLWDAGQASHSAKECCID